MKETGDAFGVHYATVNRAVRRAEMLGCKPWPYVAPANRDGIRS